MSVNWDKLFKLFKGDKYRHFAKYNVEQYYEIQLKRWYCEHSKEVTIDGQIFCLTGSNIYDKNTQYKKSLLLDLPVEENEQIGILFRDIEYSGYDIANNELTEERFLRQHIKEVEKDLNDLYDIKEVWLKNCIEKYLTFLKNKLTQLEKEQKLSKNYKNEPSKLSDLIRSEKSNEIVNEIKKYYKGIKGKELKLLFLALQELDLIQKDGRNAKTFYSFCKNESYQAMNDYKYNEKTDEGILSSMKSFIQNIINRN